MGCACSRDEATEEDKLVHAEEQLPFSNHKTKYLSVLYSKYAKSKKELSSIDLSSILADLCGKSPQNFNNFFENFKNSDGTYSLKALLVLSIMVSNGSSNEKANLIFEFFENLENKKVTREILSEIISIMLEIAVDKLPLLAPSMSIQSKVFDYVNNTLKRNKILTQEELLKEFEAKKGEIIPSAKFQAVFGDANQLVTPTYLRQKIVVVGSSKKF